MVDFQRKNWQFRDLITEGELNRIEDGIEEGITKAEQAQQTADNAQATADEANQKAEQARQTVTSHLAETASKFTNINLNIIDIAVELETLKGATLNGVIANIFIETFQNLDDINLMNGIYDSTNKRLVL